MHMRIFFLYSYTQDAIRIVTLVPDKVAHYIMLNSRTISKWKIFFIGHDLRLAMRPSMGPERSPSGVEGPGTKLSEAPAF